jgi:hypothetical protein
MADASSLTEPEQFDTWRRPSAIFLFFGVSLVFQRRQKRCAECKLRWIPPNSDTEKSAEWPIVVDAGDDQTEECGSRIKVLAVALACMSIACSRLLVCLQIHTSRINSSCRPLADRGSNQVAIDAHERRDQHVSDCHANTNRKPGCKGLGEQCDSIDRRGCG